MNINELEELTKQWSASEPEEYPATVLELIAAYREAASAIDEIQSEADLPTWFDSSLDSIIATAKRLGVE